MSRRDAAIEDARVEAVDAYATDVWLALGNTGDDDEGADSFQTLVAVGEMRRRHDAAVARAEAAEREVARLRAIIEGRTVPPTDAEIAAHAADYGSWRFRVNGSAVQTDDPHRLRVAIAAHARHGTFVRWWSHDRSDAPCAWPIAAEVTP